MRLSRFVLYLCAFFVCSSLAVAQKRGSIREQKQELNKMHEEVEESQKKLDSLQQTEQQLQKQISSQDQRINSDRKVIGRLSRQLQSLQKEIAQADSSLNDRQVMLDRTQRRYLGNIREFYKISRSPSQTLYEDPNAELNMHKRIVYLTAFTNYESQEVATAEELLTGSIKQLNELSGKHSEVRGAKKDRETSLTLNETQKRKGEKQLDQVRRLSADEYDRMSMLEKAVEEMADIIARLEEDEARRAGHGKRDGSAFTALKGQLHWPVAGKVTLTYGNHKDPVTGLRSVSPGITISPKNTNVRAIASGTVAYAGYLRGYGNFVIISHDGVYYSTYAGLTDIAVAKDQHVASRAVVGTMTLGEELKFELRKGRETVDPLQWLNLE